MRSSIVDDEPGAVCASVAVALFQSYPADVFAVCRGKTATQQKGEPEYWDVTVNYSNAPIEAGTSQASGEAPSEPGGQDQDTPPDERECTITIDQVDTTKIFRRDIDDSRAVCSSAGQPFDPPAEVPHYMTQITFSLWKAAGDDGYHNIRTYANKINSVDWTGFNGNFPAETCLVKKYALNWVFEPGHGWYWKKTVIVLVDNDDTWRVRLLDSGTYESTTAGSGIKKPKAFEDSKGQSLGTRPLDGNGKLLVEGDPFAYLVYNAYKKVDFAGLI